MYKLHIVWDFPQLVKGHGNTHFTKEENQPTEHSLESKDRLIHGRRRQYISYVRTV